jgi:DNA-binding XRE family transcriptional regulator
MKNILDLTNDFIKVIGLERKTTNRIKAEREAKDARLNNKLAHAFGGFRDRNTQAIYIPQRKKLKGYQVENRRFKKIA